MSVTKTVSNEINTKHDIIREIKEIIKYYKLNQINNYDFTKLKNLNLDNYVYFLEEISMTMYFSIGPIELNKNYKK